MALWCHRQKVSLPKAASGMALRRKVTQRRGEVPSALPEGEFLRPLRGFDYRLNEGDAQFSFFQFEDAVDGAAGGSGDGVFEQRRVVAGFEDDGGGAEGGLGSKQRGNVAGQADLDTGFGQRFQDDIDEGGSAGGEAGDGVHVFFIHHHGAADDAEQGAGVFNVPGAGVPAAAEGGHADPENARGVGHGTYHRDLDPEGRFNLGGGNRRGNRDDQLVAMHVWANLLHHFLHHLRLDAHEDYVGLVDGREIVGAYGDAKLVAQGAGTLFVGDGCAGKRGMQEVFFQQSLEQNAAHLAGAQNYNSLCRKIHAHERAARISQGGGRKRIRNALPGKNDGL